MSENDTLPEEKPFFIEIAKQGKAVCKKCKQKCVQGEIRVAKLVSSPFANGKMKTWHHVNCIFEIFSKQRRKTKRIESPHDVDGWESMSEGDKNDILKKIKECNQVFDAKSNAKTANKKQKPLNNKPEAVTSASEDAVSMSGDAFINYQTCKDNLFREFRMVVADVAKVKSSTEKTDIIRKVFNRGCDGTGFKGDIVLWCKFLIPNAIKRVFNLQSKQVTKIFSKIFHTSYKSMLKYLEQGDLGTTIQHFFQRNKTFKPAISSTLTIQDVDEFLEELSNLTKEDDQIDLLKKLGSRCTGNDLKIVVRLIKHDLRMNAGAKHVLEAVHPDAYQIFQASKDLKSTINCCWEGPQKKPKENTESETKKSDSSNGGTKNPPKRSKSKSDVQNSNQTDKKKRGPKRKLSNSSETSSNKKSKPEDVKTKSPEVKTVAPITETEISTDVVHKESEMQVTVSEPQNSESDNAASDSRKPIPNYFCDVKLLLEEGVTERHAEWIRYIIAYGGVVLKPDEFEQATHVLHLKDTISEPTIKSASSARHVIVEWIKDTVTKEQLRDCRPYTVRWDPNHKT